MATLATFFRRSDLIAAGERATKQHAKEHATVARAGAYQLRALPNDDVYFFCKRIDNSRIVKQADPQARGECWSAIGAACMAAVLFGSIMVPKVGSILAGYKLQTLKQEQAGLLQERRNLEVAEATLLSPARLDGLAARHEMVKPESDQIIHLEPKTDNAFALNFKAR